MILLVSYGGGHVSIIHKLIDKLNQLKIDFLYLPLTTAISYCKKNSIEHLEYNQLANEYLSNSKLDLSFVDEFVNRTFKAESIVSKKATKAYYSIGFNDLIKEYSKYTALELYKKYGRRSFEPKEFAKFVLKKYNVKKLITTNVDRTEYAFRFSAKKLNIPVFSIDDLFGEYANKDKILSDIVFVDNKIAKKNILNMKYKGKIIISGNPVFNALKKNNKQNNDLLIVLTTGVSSVKMFQNFIHFDDNFHQNFFHSIENQVLKKFEKITVRFHPSMKKKRYWNSELITIDQTTNYHDSLNLYSNVMGVNCSTTIYEAYLSSRNIYNFQLKGDYRMLPIRWHSEIQCNGKVNFSRKNGITFSNDQVSDSALKILTEVLKF